MLCLLTRKEKKKKGRKKKNLQPTYLSNCSLPLASPPAKGCSPEQQQHKARVKAEAAGKLSQSGWAGAGGTSKCTSRAQVPSLNTSTSPQKCLLQQN